MFLGHDDSRVLSTDLVQVNAKRHHLDAIRIFERSDLEDLGIDSSGGGGVCGVFGFGGFIVRGRHSERTDGRKVTYGLYFLSIDLGFVVCCMRLRLSEVPVPAPRKL